MPACLGPSPWEPLSVEGEEHWAAPLLPVKRGIGVVAVLLQALLEVTVGAVDFRSVDFPLSVHGQVETTVDGADGNDAHAHRTDLHNTVRALLPLRSVYFATAVDTQEELCGRIELPPTHVALQVVIRTGAPAAPSPPLLTVQFQDHVSRLLSQSTQYKEHQRTPKSYTTEWLPPTHSSPGCGRENPPRFQLGEDKQIFQSTSW